MTTIKKEVSRTKALALAQAAIGKVHKVERLGRCGFVFHTPFDKDNLSGATTSVVNLYHDLAVLRRRNEVVLLALHIMGYGSEFCSSLEYHLQGDDFGTAKDLLKKYDTGLTSANCKEYLI